MIIAKINFLTVGSLSPKQQQQQQKNTKSQWQIVIIDITLTPLTPTLSFQYALTFSDSYAFLILLGQRPYLSDCSSMKETECVGCLAICETHDGLCCGKWPELDSKISWIKLPHAWFPSLMLSLLLLFEHDWLESFTCQYQLLFTG